MRSTALPKIRRHRRASQSGCTLNGEARVRARGESKGEGESKSERGFFTRLGPGPGLVRHKSVCRVNYYVRKYARSYRQAYHYSGNDQREVWWVGSFYGSQFVGVW